MYFQMYFDEKFFETTALCTSQYYFQKNNRELCPVLTPMEISVFFGIHAILGCVMFPRMKMIWSTRFKFDPVSSAMSRDILHAEG